MKAVLLAGGGGTRLWPLSRNATPKQLQSFLGKESLLQKTYHRLRRFLSVRDILIATNTKHVQFLRRQLPKLPPSQIISEPVKRDTAAAIGLAAAKISHMHPHETVAVVYADHVVLNERAYQESMRLADRLVTAYPTHTALVGIEPTYPETGYGYIKLAKRFRFPGKAKVYVGDRFVEKPDAERAKKFIKRWDYLWNPGMFVWKVDHLLALYKKYLPQHFHLLEQVSPSFGTAQEQSAIGKFFPRMKPISIDFGIMEKLKRMLVIPASMGWADIGHWRTVHEMSASDGDGNMVRGRHVNVHTKKSLVLNFTDRLVATAGLSNLIVVNTEDAVLVCDREHAQDVKKIVEVIKKKKWLQYL
ncbi:MAG: sugar phosphate nucleotidyltransferase [Patescibacteria group bacterium]|jgi:mannose-1-phosphate guanylyltransferase